MLGFNIWGMCKVFWGYSLFAPRIVPFLGHPSVPFIGHPPEHNIRLFLQLYGSLKIFVFSLLLVTMSLSITHTFYFPAWNSDQHSLPFFPTQSATTLSLVSEQPVQYFAVLLWHTLHLSWMQLFLPAYFLCVIIGFALCWCPVFCQSHGRVKRG